MDGSGAGPDATNPHPDRKVPALLHDGVLLTESAAIAAYLADLVPAAGLAPALGDTDRGPYLTWLSRMEGEFGPAIIERFAAGPAAPAPLAFERALRRLDAALAPGGFLLGERFSAADVMLGGHAPLRSQHHSGERPDRRLPGAAHRPDCVRPGDGA